MKGNTFGWLALAFCAAAIFVVVAIGNVLDMHRRSASDGETLVCVAFGVPVTIRAVDVRYDDGLWTYRPLDAQGQPGAPIRSNMACTARIVEP